MEVRTILNRDVLKEIKRFYPHPAAKAICYTVGTVLAIFTLGALLIEEIPLCVMFAFLTALMLLEIPLMEALFIKQTFKKYREVYHREEITGTVTFREDGLLVRNNVTGGEVLMHYPTIVKFCSTKNYFVLISKERQMLPIDKEQFFEPRREAFLSLVKEKMPQLKVKA